MNEVNEDLYGIVDRWCPAGFDDESFSNRMIRALLNLSAFEKDFESKRSGKEPIRTDYPIKLEWVPNVEVHRAGEEKP